MRGEEPIQNVDNSLPDGWERKRVEDCLSTDGVERRPSIPRSAYRTKGRFPVVDQGQALIAGFTDDETSVHRMDLPLIVFGDHTRAVKFVDFPFATGADGTKLLRAKSNQIDPRFFYYGLLNIELPSRGYNRHFGLLREKSIDLPCDPEEQHGIADVLSKLHARVEIQDRIVGRLKELKAATTAKLFREGLRGEPLKQTEVGEIPESWVVRPIGSLFEIQLGKMLSGAARLGLSPKPYLRNANVQWNRFDLSDLYKMDFSEREMGKFALRPGDILVCEGGEPGRAALWRGELRECYYQKALHRLRPLPRVAILPGFFVHWATAAFLLFKSHGEPATKTTIAHLPAVKLAATQMSVPSPEEQETITRILDRIHQRLQTAERLLDSIRSLFDWSLNQLLTGKIRLGAPRPEAVRV